MDRDSSQFVCFPRGERLKVDFISCNFWQRFNFCARCLDFGELRTLSERSWLIKEQVVPVSGSYSSLKAACTLKIQSIARINGGIKLVRTLDLTFQCTIRASPFLQPQRTEAIYYFYLFFYKKFVNLFLRFRQGFLTSCGKCTARKMRGGP